MALPLLLDWLERAQGARLLGFLPTMYKPRRGDARQWLTELERLADGVHARVFPPIGDLASLASFRMDGHPYAPLADAVEEAVLGALVYGTDLLRRRDRCSTPGRRGRQPSR